MDSSHFQLCPLMLSWDWFMGRQGSSDELPHQRVSDSVFSPDIDKLRDPRSLRKHISNIKQSISAQQMRVWVHCCVVPHLLEVVADPQGDRGAPVAVPGNGPVSRIPQPVPKTLFPHKFWNPGHTWYLLRKFHFKIKYIEYQLRATTVKVQFITFRDSRFKAFIAISKVKEVSQWNSTFALTMSTEYQNMDDL